LAKHPIYKTYTPKKFRSESLRLIEKVNEILADYASQGFDMTLRQVYYQLVKANEIENKQTAYDNLGALLSDARRAGLVAWNMIEDRTRNLRSFSTWINPRDMQYSAAAGFRLDKWQYQPLVIEAWIEKEALAGVLASACAEFEIPHFACRGYVSDSELWNAAQRVIRRFEKTRQTTLILHLGDHDPSGIDMTRDNRDRFHLFGAASFIEVERVALNLDQIQSRDLPPNPAKQSDARFRSYMDQFGVDESWELDALTPVEISDLIETAVAKHRDPDKWDKALADQEAGEAQLMAIYDRWPDVEALIGTWDAFKRGDDYL
jgi:hypothetical protein